MTKGRKWVVRHYTDIAMAYSRSGDAMICGFDLTCYGTGDDPYKYSPMSATNPTSYLYDSHTDEISSKFSIYSSITIIPNQIDIFPVDENRTIVAIGSVIGEDITDYYDECCELLDEFTKISTGGLDINKITATADLVKSNRRIYGSKNLIEIVSNSKINHGAHIDKVISCISDIGRLKDALIFFNMISPLDDGNNIKNHLWLLNDII